MDQLTKKELRYYANFLNRLAKDMTRFYYLRLNKPFKAINKSRGKGYDPVTKADRAFEKFIRSKIQKKFPKHEIINIFQKVYWKKYASEEGFSIVSKKTRVLTEYFDDYRPLAFFGTTTLHGNNYVSEKADIRLTFLCHLYDPSPKYGIGALLRKIRGR